MAYLSPKERMKRSLRRQEAEIKLITGETFILDNEMRTNRSCTIWDVYRFRQEGLLKEVKQHEQVV